MTCGCSKWWGSKNNAENRLDWGWGRGREGGREIRLMRIRIKLASEKTLLPCQLAFQTSEALHPEESKFVLTILANVKQSLLTVETNSVGQVPRRHRICAQGPDVLSLVWSRLLMAICSCTATLAQCLSARQ